MLTFVICINRTLVHFILSRSFIRVECVLLQNRFLIVIKCIYHSGICVTTNFVFTRSNNLIYFLKPILIKK